MSVSKGKMELGSVGRGNRESLRFRWQQEHTLVADQRDHAYGEGQGPRTFPELDGNSPQTTHEMSIPTHSSEHRRESRSRRRPTYQSSDSLELAQTGQQERERRSSEGREGNLTELAEPDPVDRHRSRRQSYEEEERKERRNSQQHGESETGAFLTELTAPPPVEEVYETGSRAQDEEKYAGSEAPSSHSRDDKAETEKDTNSAAATQLYTISYLIFFSILGTLARLGTQAINRYPQSPFPSVILWANVGGSLFMGFLAEDRQIFRQEWGTNSKKWSFNLSQSDLQDAEKLQEAKAAHGKVKKTIPLFIGLAVGFCGSFTSFSSFMRDAFLALTNNLSSPSETVPFDANTPSYPRNGGYSFEATLAVLIIEVACSLCALHFGAHLALLTDSITPTLPFKVIRRIVDPLMVFLAFGCWFGAIFLTIFPPENVWRGRATFSLVFAPLGCLLRFYASKFLNARVPAFPLGTFFVNIFGTAILGMSYDLQHADGVAAVLNGSVTACQVLEGVMEGFCGCTTTVSTWVVELTSLRRQHAYIYGMTSVGVGLGLLVVIMGSVGWTSGFERPTCSV